MEFLANVLNLGLSSDLFLQIIKSFNFFIKGLFQEGFFVNSGVESLYDKVMEMSQVVTAIMGIAVAIITLIFTIIVSVAVSEYFRWRKLKEDTEETLKRAKEAEEKIKQAIEKAEESKNKAEEAQKKTEEALKKAEDSKNKAEQAQEKTEEALKKAEESKNKAEEAQEKTEEALRKAKDAYEKAKEVEEHFNNLKKSTEEYINKIRPKEKIELDLKSEEDSKIEILKEIPQEKKEKLKDFVNKLEFYETLGYKYTAEDYYYRGIYFYIVEGDYEKAYEFFNKATGI
uniref:Uncharacterized protein n=1 Tax=uncultured Aquificaceae bacterium TaxID=374108 RepID=A0A146JC95_9AQUI|nr:hypothetical protein [uncultured Aquificaceae bacterium]